MPVNFNSIPITNATECDLIFVGCNVELGPGAAGVLNCTCGELVEEGVPVRHWVFPPEVVIISPPSFCAVTECTAQVVVITVWTPTALSVDAEVTAAEIRLESKTT